MRASDRVMSRDAGKRNMSRLDPELRIYHVNPLEDERWDSFIGNYSGASVFHSGGWLRALQLTYGYEPIAYTSCAPDAPLTNAIVFCRIRSWLTGNRIVSAPFSDHCDPLVEDESVLSAILTRIGRDIGHQRWKYAELRPLNVRPAISAGLAGYSVTEQFCFHRVDLTPASDELFRSFHKSCVQRKVTRSEREGLIYEHGRSEKLLRQFYHLMVMTRRRHQLPPQPIEWFRNLIRCLGDAATVRIVSKDGVPAAGIVTLRGGDSLVYKYGASDPAFNQLGGTPLLFWKAIQEAKESGCQYFDLGRSEMDNEGLISFKEHWGAPRRVLSYYRFPATPARETSAGGWKSRVADFSFGHLPDSVLVAAGRLLYKHVG